MTSCTNLANITYFNILSHIRYKDGLYYRTVESIIYKQLKEKNMQIIYPAHSNRLGWAFCLLYEQNVSFNTIME
ncbi:hypothetical protein EGS86_12030 [Bacillus sp. (in: firmicutes)]|uniref:Uncharacterized protein n=1 Tax=Bacillus thuringiensis TaxID=1428 RepID=A0A4Y8T1J9_BACTU|nr:hypothetical protein EGS86_12030 [Bacillus sp. (in: firmicutes)]TFF44790.1 hypothetical protein EQ803_21690 [Bacillus thuringiensis]